MKKQKTPKRDCSGELIKLRSFFSQIARLTLDHDVINDRACVTADKLGSALETVDKEWWKPTDC